MQKSLATDKLDSALKRAMHPLGVMQLVIKDKDAAAASAADPNALRAAAGALRLPSQGSFPAVPPLSLPSPGRSGGLQQAGARSRSGSGPSGTPDQVKGLPPPDSVPG